MDQRIEKKSRNVLFVYNDVSGGDWEKWYLLRSDAHHDSDRNNRKLQKKHLDLAVQRNAHIIDFGDLFDAMQGRYDPRKSYPDMRIEYLQRLNEGEKYYNIIVDDAVDFYSPYADRWIMQGVGNHEQSVSKNADIDLISMFLKDMQQKGSQVEKGSYGGWIKFLFTINGTQRQSINLKYNHGYGGGGPVTKGVIQSNRQSVYTPDASIVVNGHIHEAWVLALPRERLSEQGVIKKDIQFHVRTPTYKDDFGDGSEGWHVERGMPPKPMGCVWMKFYRDEGQIKVSFDVDLE